eukprot:TRINITY_DN87_c18_g1_i1.p1 TRINITY_DN87_c18_g1~~TRINITY_DN87_c18_g1_i1.p1  ORF type:complete len:108 (-),score=8.60 TRINITY_DN87_c18_g1_i1:101-424(-)
MFKVLKKRREKTTQNLTTLIGNSVSILQAASSKRNALCCIQDKNRATTVAYRHQRVFVKVVTVSSIAAMGQVGVTTITDGNKDQLKREGGEGQKGNRKKYNVLESTS